MRVDELLALIALVQRDIDELKRAIDRSLGGGKLTVKLRAPN